MRRRLGADVTPEADAQAIEPVDAQAVGPVPAKRIPWLWIALGLGAAGAGVWWMMRSRKKAKAKAGAREAPAVASALVRPPVPTPPPALPPAPPSVGDPQTAEFWEQPPPPGRETVGPTEPLPSGTDYTFKAGESWSNVAERTYGNMRWWPFIFDANRAKYPNPDQVKVGDTIFVPDANKLPTALKDKYFLRAEEHKRIWALHRRSKQWGKSQPTLPATVLEPTAAA